ncbi:hypothetical protein RvVAR0630_30330 [Agrobacterium vitis]|uniref:hypothetical protein n=1 Tax=Agrobacterium vitis TaxID=373 RepID=UPI0015D734B9|nr:hypothetical protein [Agrobacterium vitis]BCH60409.1 hypothetical protein RvVAR0630_30330 [Agrobacterium vitis]
MTYQRPAYEEVAIAHGGSTLTLRPTLRAAATLEARYSFPALFRALDECDFTIVSDIILTCSTSRQDAVAFLGAGSGRPLSPFFRSVQAPLYQLVSMLTPAPAPNAKPVTNTGKPLPWAEYYAALFEHATGWLNWSPETAWNSTPTEIDRAYAGHISKLKAVHGSSEEDEKQAATPEPDASFDRNGLEALRSNIQRHGR